MEDGAKKYYAQLAIKDAATDQNAYIIADALVTAVEADYQTYSDDLARKEALLGKLEDDKKAWDASIVKKNAEEVIAKEAARVAKLSTDVADAKAAFKVFSDVKDAMDTALNAWKEAGQKWHLKKADDVAFKAGADALIAAK